jgi:hypothetical protein
MNQLTERVEVQISGKTYYVRELGYLEFVELSRKAKVGDVEAVGMEIMRLTMLASVEDIEGKPMFDDTSLRRLKKSIFEPLSKAAMKAQGLDLDEKREPLSAEDVEGNAEPSRKSGSNSPEPAAAQSAN